jgi:hypothetical protein
MNVRSPSTRIYQNDDLFHFPPEAPLRPAPKRSRPLRWWQLPLHGWYYLTAPPEAPENARLGEREAARRGHLASVVLFFVILLVLPAIPTAIGNPVLTVILALVITIDIVALVLNRSGRTTLAGVLVVVGIEIGLGSSILTVPGGLGASNLPMLDLMVQAECVAVSLLLPSSVFLVAFVNALFFVCVLNLTPVTPDLAQLLKTDGSRIVSSPIILQVIVAIVTYLWVTSANKAIQRADRAEEIATLEQREIERQQQEIEQKQQLDIGIQQILQTHVEVANGNFTARAPLGRENVLWQIAYSLNNLLARLQSYSQMIGEYQHLQEENYRLHDTLQSKSSAQQELQRTREAAAYLVELIERSKGGRIHALPLRTGTIIDSVAAHLNGYAPAVPFSQQGQVIPQRPREQTIPKRLRPEMK